MEAHYALIDAVKIKVTELKGRQPAQDKVNEDLKKQMGEAVRDQAVLTRNIAALESVQQLRKSTLQGYEGSLVDLQNKQGVLAIRLTEEEEKCLSLEDRFADAERQAEGIAEIFENAQAAIGQSVLQQKRMEDVLESVKNDQINFHQQLNEFKGEVEQHFEENDDVYNEKKREMQMQIRQMQTALNLLHENLRNSSEKKVRRFSSDFSKAN